MSAESKLVNLMMKDENARQFIEDNFEKDQMMSLQRLLTYLEYQYLKPPTDPNAEPSKSF